MYAHEHYNRALQLGLPQVTLLPSSQQAKHHYVLAEENAPIVAQFEHLPLPTESMDLVVVPFVLSQHPKRHAILREIQRVLCGYGQLLVLDLNPYSLWRLQAKRLEDLTACQYHHAIAPKHMSDRLGVLGLNTQSSRFIHYGPLLQQAKTYPRLDLAGNRWWPHGAAMYALQAVKQLVYLQPLHQHHAPVQTQEENLILNPVSSRKP